MRFTFLIVLCLVAVAIKQSASKYTTLLENEEPNNGDNNINNNNSNDDEPSLSKGSVAAANKPTTVSYGKLIYEQGAPEESAAGKAPEPAPSSEKTGNTNQATQDTTNTRTNNNQTASASGQHGGKDESNGDNASVLSRIYSNISYYLPFLARLTNLRQGNVNATTTSKDYELHAKPNVSVPIARDLSRPADEKDNQDKTIGGSISIMKIDGENRNSISNNNNNRGANVRTNQNNINNGDAIANNDDDVGDDLANQDNRQSQGTDKQRNNMMNVKISIDRKQTTDDEDEGGERGTDNYARNEPDISNQVEDDTGSRDEQNSLAAAAHNNFIGLFGNPIERLADLNEAEQNRQQIKLKSGDLKRDQVQQQYPRDDDDNIVNNNDEGANLDVDMNQMVPVAVRLGNLQSYLDQTEQENEHQPIDLANRYNMMKQSSLVVPLSSSNDVLTGTGPKTTSAFGKQPESLLGKYIYAPTQHYYLNSMAPTGHNQHHSLAPSGKHIHPGDHIYGSYGHDMPMKAAYAYQKDQNLVGDKPNDMYFLIMVGAFCMMATTVVLAAGMFAYRIQQSRKSSQDTGYPTYGVVGPNNMSAKCGAASFVGGYFTGPPGGGAGSSKSGSARHLADLYSCTPNGTCGSDSGLNSLDKSSSNKKASSVSSLNEYHQNAASRTVSSNFMTASSQDAARMYHYQHQKQQMIISDRNSGGRQTTASDLDSEDENDDGSYTVYECPGLASAHEMEIKNPLFNDDQSP